VQEEFSTLQSNFNREAEYSRIARKAADNLQEEYCRIVHSVATEKQRNLMFIERAKRELVAEITTVNSKVSEIDSIKQLIKELDLRYQKNETEMMFH